MSGAPEIPCEIAPGVVPQKARPPAAAPLGGLLCEPNGQVSSVRVAFLVALICVLFVWLVLSLRGGQILELPWSITAALAALAGGKVLQRFAEGKR